VERFAVEQDLIMHQQILDVVVEKLQKTVVNSGER
jgi:hypothetical protein